MPPGRPSGRCVLEGLKHDVEVAADSRPRSVIGAKRRLADRQRPLILFSCTYQHDRRSEWTLPSRQPDTHSDTRPDSRPGWTPWLGLLDGASGHQGGRPPRPTARPDTFLWSSAATRRDPQRRGDRSGRSTCPGWTLVDGDRGHRTRSDAGHRRRQRVDTVARDRLDVALSARASGQSGTGVRSAVVCCLGVAIARSFLA